MRRFVTALVAMALCLFAHCGEAAGKRPSSRGRVPRISAQAVRQLMLQGKPVVIVNAADWYPKGPRGFGMYICGSIRIPYTWVLGKRTQRALRALRVFNITRDKWVVCYCP